MNQTILILGSNAACSLNNNSVGSKYCGTYLGMTSGLGSTSAINLSICGKNRKTKKVKINIIKPLFIIINF